MARSSGEHAEKKRRAEKTRGTILATAKHGPGNAGQIEGSDLTIVNLRLVARTGKMSGTASP
jgi:hypothetical protein